MKVFGITDRGSVRRQNQDAFDYRVADGAAFAVVCDGMGGAKAGNIASSMAVTACMQTLERPFDDPAVMMSDAAYAANETIYDRAMHDPDCDGMGTTLVAAFLEPDGYTSILNVGDSRAYHVTPHAIRQITRDHSLVEDLVEAGKITREQARTHPNKNIITRALGTESEVPADLFDANLRPGEMILLCTDGLTNVLTDREILHEIHRAEGDLEGCCRQLVTMTLDRGAPDNVTAVLMRYDGENQ